MTAAKRTVRLPWLRGPLARALRPLLLRWPWVRGRKTLRRRLVPTLAQIPVGKVARMRRRWLIRIHDDPVYREIWLFGEFDPIETAIYQRFLEPGETVVDVGANFGWHTIGFAKAVGAHGRVLAFEPLPELVEHAGENLRRNRVEEWVTLRDRALGSAPGELTIYTFAKGSMAESSASDLGRDDAEPHPCVVATLDEELAQFGGDPPVLLKVDVEGFELDVFRGGVATLAGSRAPALAFELNRGCLEHAQVTVPEIEEYLRGVGYLAFWRVDPSRGVEEVGTLDWEGPPGHANVFAAKANLADRLRAAIR